MFKNHIYVLKKLKKFIPYIKPYIGKEIIVLIILFLFTVVSLIQPLINRFAINVFFATPTIKVFIELSSYILIVFVITKILTIIKENLLTYISSYMSLGLRKKLINTIFNVKYENLSEVSVGELFVSFDLDIGTVQNTITNTLVNYILSIFTIIVATYFMLRISPLFFFMMLILIPFAIINNRIWFKRLISTSKLLRTKTAGVFDFVQNMIYNIKGIQKVSRDRFFKLKFLNAYSEFIGATFKNLNFNLAYGAVNDLILNVEQMILFGVAGYLIYVHKIKIGGYVALAAYGSMFKSHLMDFINFDINMKELVVSADRLEKFFNLPQLERDGKEENFDVKDIKIQDLNFKYNEKQENVLKNINLTIKDKDKITIIGESGSGKSTLISLLSGLYVSESVKLTTKNLKEIDIKNYRRKITFVSQDPYIFEGTIRENLCLGIKIKEKRLIEICKLVNIFDYIESLESKFDFKLENNAKNLSGGQKQRLSLARALLQNPSLLILDEATSALDKKTETEILEKIYEYLKEKTIISITHRIENSKFSDIIYEMKHGKLEKINK